MADATINIELKGIAQIRSELKALKGELANATDPEQMARLAEQAGVLSDRLKDANEKVAVFAAGSPFEQTNNALGLMGSQLMSLDFEGAAESSKLFASAAKGINGDVIAKSLKSLGTVVVQVGKAFMTVGLSLLTNPIFLIAAAIVGIVTVIGILLNKLGLLKPILNAIGQVFGFIGKIIDGVVQSIKDFLDWMGLTNFAAEEAAKKQVSALEKIDKKREEQINGVTKQYDLQIRLAQIDGKNTTDMERKKQQAILATAQTRYKATMEQIEQMKLTGEADAEEIKKLKEKAKGLRETAQNARNEIKIIDAQEKADNRKKNEELEKQDKESYKKRADQAKQYAADRLAAMRQIRDLELEVMEEGKEKELAALNEKYKRLIEDTQKNEKLLSDEKKRLIALYSEEQFNEQKAIDQKYTDELNQSIIALTQKRAEEEKTRQDALDALYQENQQKRAEEDKKRKEKALAEEKAYNEARLNLGGDLVKGLQGLDALLQQAGVKTAGLQKTIALVQIATDTAKAISATIAGASAAAAAGGPAAPFLLAGYIASGIGTILSAVASAYAALKKAPPVGGSGGGGGSVPSASATSTTAAQPNVQMFGQNNNANNLTSAQTMENNGQNITVKAVVSETEITSTQNKIQKITQAASL